MNAPVRVSLGGKMVPMLTMHDLIVLAEELHEAQATKLRTNMLAAAVCDEERAKAVRDFETYRGSLSPLVQNAYTMPGSLRIIGYACAKHGIADVDSVLSPDPREVFRLAASLITPPIESRAEGNAPAEGVASDSPPTTSA